MIRSSRRVRIGWFTNGAERLNVLLTNRVPRRLLTRLMGWYSRIESRHLTRLSIAVWQCFVDDLRLDEAEQREFASLQACFVRRLKAGARPVVTSHGLLVSPCDAEIGAMGSIKKGRLFQAKGRHYTLEALLIDPLHADEYRDGYFITLRLKSSMYHRFHAPADCSLDYIRYLPGDVRNVNPPTLKRIEKVLCRNERAVLPLTVDGIGSVLTLVPVAAILVGSIRLNGIDIDPNLRLREPNRILCNLRFERGQEMGWFEHGSTIIALARGSLRPHPDLRTGQIIRMGQPLLVDAEEKRLRTV